jgi:hypothetical protein
LPQRLSMSRSRSSGGELAGAFTPRVPHFLPSCGTAPRASAFGRSLGDIDMAVDQTALRHIGKLMHQHFDAIVSEPLPPRLHELVERLKVQPEPAKPQSPERADRSQEALIRVPSFRTAPA